MRIVGGTWRGRRLPELPKGALARPTTDREREALASMLLVRFDLDLSEVTVLDAFAGSGALGFELLSRGARWCSFVEKQAIAYKALIRTAACLGCEATRYEILHKDSFALAGSPCFSAPGGQFSCVLLDPPYAMEPDEVSRLLDCLIVADVLSPSACIMYEHAATKASLIHPDFVLTRSKTHGTTTIDLLSFDRK